MIPQYAVLLPGRQSWLVAFRGELQERVEELAGITPTVEVAPRSVPEAMVRGIVQALNPGVVWVDRADWV